MDINHLFVYTTVTATYNICMYVHISGVSSMELRVLEHPPQLWYLSSSVTNTVMIIDNWQLLPTINLQASKIHSLKSVFSLPLGLKSPSLSAIYLQERINEGCGNGQRFGGVAKTCARTIDLAPPSFKSWIRHCICVGSFMNVVVHLPCVLSMHEK